MKVTPLYDRVLLKRLEEQEVVKGGIIIPDTAKEKPQRGQVVAAGPGKRGPDGKRIAPEIKAGDKQAAVATLERLCERYPHEQFLQEIRRFMDGADADLAALLAHGETAARGLTPVQARAGDRGAAPAVGPDTDAHRFTTHYELDHGSVKKGKLDRKSVV